MLATIMEGIFTLIESYRNEQPGYVKLEPTQTTKGKWDGRQAGIIGSMRMRVGVN